jgi:hypothetical protein
VTSGATAFDKLKTLVGTWCGTTPGGRPVGVTYRLSAGGSALVETWDLGPQREALTIYHLDGAELMATHFCPHGNQPRLKMTRAVGQKLDFSFHDATGLLPGQGVQQAFWIEVGADRFTRSETYLQDGRSETETIAYERLERQAETVSSGISASS